LIWVKTVIRQHRPGPSRSNVVQARSRHENTVEEALAERAGNSDAANSSGSQRVRIFNATSLAKPPNKKAGTLVPA